ncbi:hypothetical protein CMI37_00410 [Candidatus Pacearchaeota archaeon]|nr:hypothetical protein [Candidatus Pacearchaeota archaeon]
MAASKAPVGEPLSSTEEVMKSYELQPFKRVDRTLAKLIAADMASKDEIRFLVDSFYQIQNMRIRTANQIRSLQGSGIDNDVIQWFGDYNELVEEDLDKILQYWAEGQKLGQWCLSIHGIGHRITASLMAYIDIEKAPTVGHIWRYAGLDPTNEWISADKAKKIVAENVSSAKPTNDEIIKIANLINRKPSSLKSVSEERKNNKPTGRITKDSLTKGLAKRPYNANLKKLCYKISDQIGHRQVNNPKNIYGPLFLDRKAYEHRLNDEGKYREWATSKIGTVGKTTIAGKAYAEGRLSDGEIQNRSRRWIVKLFLSHYHHVAYNLRFGTNPPKPYPFAHLGHGTVIDPPNWPME